MRSFLFFFLIFIAFSCANNEARRPINPKPSTTIFASTVNEAKRLRKLEENYILEYINKDTTQNYIQSSDGFWYYYQQKVNFDLPKPVAGDTILFTYDITTLQDSILYSQQELGNITYIVDKQDLLSGIQKGIKYLKVGETVTFVFPSFNAFGVAGDGNKVGMNTPIKSTITLLNIK